MKNRLHQGVFCALIVLLSCNGCASFNASSNEYAMRNEEASQRQQVELDRPALDNKQVYLDMIKKMQERSLYFASIAHIDSYQKTYGTSPEVQRLYADALRATGQDDSAEKQYRALLNGTEAAAAWHGLGLLEAQRGSSAKAISNLRVSSRLDPTNALVLSDLSYALLADGDNNAARIPLMQAVELAPGNRKVISNLALFFMLSGDEAKAEALMKEAKMSSEVRAEILKRQESITKGKPKSASTQDARSRIMPVVASGSGMQLQLQMQLLSPQSGVSARSE
ncbi:pilus assembly protein [Herminiimonas sp. KBW02]|uniref:pilus assembly protein n=1 Tax=Herminiimonas sp. KBW02 TaxID=2153363 RepID=UPI000F5AB932|nr:pilus assembly protein [Herminiimonas sp. KBW02]RQO34666.1 pilus assembly protein [Herminiimonas sp. KBW02]